MSIFTEEVEKILPEGFKMLVDGYGKYSAEVAVARALPAIDGFKPSQRRLLYTMHKNRVKDLCKSANVCGKVLEYHPHSDASVYETAILMVDSAEYTQFPFIHGKGNFSKVYFSDKDSQPAASRYTEMCLSDKAETIFAEMDGVPFQPTEDGHTNEPVLLPTSFPNVLCTPTMGIAVGIACNIPSFNFNEVLGITLEYLKTGKITQMIAPDFHCGGDYVLNNDNIRKIMVEGRGSIKLRGRWEIDGKDIVITQIPFYATISDILSKARTFKGVVSANDETDLNGMRIRISCSNKAIVNTVLLQLLRDTPLQVSSGVNIGVVIGEEPIYTGVVGVIEAWCKFRREVLEKQYTKDLARVRNAMRAPKALMRLLDNPELKEKYLNAVKVSVGAALAVLHEGLPDVDEDVIDYIMDLKIRSFADYEGRKRQYENLLSQEKNLMECLADLNAVIIGQLTTLNNKYRIPRKTSIVSNDYSFESIEEEKKSANQVENYGVHVIFDGKFVKKMRFYSGDMKKALFARNTDTLMLLDSNGRLLKTPLSVLADSSESAVGSYMPRVLDLPDNFVIKDAYILSEGIVSYLYNDGFIATLDLSEWKDTKRVTKVTTNGVAAEHISKMLGRIETNKDFVFCVTQNNCLGFLPLKASNKSRTARMKLGTVPKGDAIKAYVPVTSFEAMQLLTGNVERYYGKCCPLAADVVYHPELLQKLLST